MKYLLLFISLVFSFSANADTDIFDIARSGNSEKLIAYIKNGGTLNVVNGRGYSPFILATYYNQQNVASILLGNNIDPCATDDAGNNAFMGVAFKGYKSMATWLLENTDCSLNHRNYAGQTALMMAALFDRETLVELFIKNGADISIKDFKGNTAETLAAGQGLGRIVDIVRFNLANR